LRLPDQLLARRNGLRRGKPRPEWFERFDRILPLPQSKVSCDQREQRRVLVRRGRNILQQPLQSFVRVLSVLLAKVIQADRKFESAAQLPVGFCLLRLQSVRVVSALPAAPE
jgi:hypothetical protein